MNQYSFTYRLVRDGLKTTSDIISGHFGEPTAEQPQDTAEGIPLIMYRYSLNPGKQWQAAWTPTFKLVLALRDEVEAHGGHLAVILVPGREEEDRRCQNHQREAFPEDHELYLLPPREQH